MDKKITDKIVTQIGKTEIGREPALGVERPVVIPNAPKPDRPTKEVQKPSGGGGGGGGGSVVIPDTSVNYMAYYQMEFISSPEFDVPSGFCGTKIEEINLSLGMRGGKEPYTFDVAKINRTPLCPDWLNLATDGKITGTRPSEPRDAAKATFTVTDDRGEKMESAITINVGSVIKPLIRQPKERL